MAGVFDELKRRHVFRVALAYLAIAWVIIQFIDVTGPILNLPVTVARFAFFVLAIGFPIAVGLAWTYDITSKGIVESSTENIAKTVPGFGGRKIDLVIIGALSLAVVLLVVDNYVLQRPATDSKPVAEISDYPKITASQVIFPPELSPHPLVVEESRLYFTSWNSGALELNQLLRSGGDAIPLNANFDGLIPVTPHDTTPDGTHLVIEAANTQTNQRSLWLWPVVGGAPRKLGAGAQATFSPDGNTLFYSDGFSVGYLANPDLSEPREILKVPGKIYWPQFSPDGQRIRYTLTIPPREYIWQVPAAGGKPRRWLPDWQATRVCCGRWTPDGRHFVFQATRNDRTQLWAVTEEDGVFGKVNSEPVQITTGPLEFRRPTISDDGKTIYAIGWQLRGEVVHYDFDINRYVPIPGLESLSAEWLVYSNDGDWIAYVSHPDGEIWRSRADGSDRLQLTKAPLKANDLEWSPNGQTIAFTGKLPGEPEKVFVVSRDGSMPERISDGRRPERMPTWSPDGQQLAFDVYGRNPIQLYDISSGEISEIGEPHELDMQKWSPDGRYFAARSKGMLKLYDVQTNEYEDLVETPFVTRHYWSADSQFVYFHDPVFLQGSHWVRRINIHDKTVEDIAPFDDVRSAWGTTDTWVGISPDGAPMLLRDLSIHHIYALEWNVE